MKDAETAQELKEQKDQQDRVQVTVLYTSTAKEEKFRAETSFSLAKVIDIAYDKLKEERRAGDQYFCHDEPRHDLAPYMNKTLKQMHREGICVREKNRNKLEFEFDIDSEIGGAGF